MKPRVFIGSSSEHHDIAVAVQTHLSKATLPTVWDQDSVRPGEVLADSLIRRITESDFAVLVFARDDLLRLRGQELHVTRDNVLFELGLAMGILGREHTAAILPQNDGDFRIPPDLGGILWTTYDSEREDKNWKAATADACSQLVESISRHAIRKGCQYLKRYVESKEPSFLEPDSHVPVSFERLYQILLYMFKHETINQFRAFDLSFQRWKELLRPDDTQTFNISNEIFVAMGRMFATARCRVFRRLLVIAPEQLRTHAAAQILSRFRNDEARWRSKHSGVTVETRVLVYPDRSQTETRNVISRLRDFALFTGDDGNFALLEEKSSPYDEVLTPECHVVTTAASTEKMARSFDDFWDDARTTTEIIAELSKRDNRDVTRSPAFKAFEYFLNAYAAIESQCALVIEAGYFDLRRPADADRLDHLDDAFWLLDSVRSSCESVRRNVFLDAFINDLGNLNICNIHACETPELLTESDRERLMAIDDLLNGLRQQYRLNDIGPDEFQIFGMKTTRNDVWRRIRELLAKGDPAVKEATVGPTVDVYAEPRNAPPIFLGSREDSQGMIARCSALLAQHYFDLYKFVLSKRPQIRELWIFDFNRQMEAESVRMGAEASFVLHPWPADFKLHIVNCIYSADGSTGDIQVISPPTDG
jgi:hypothetical protein